MRRQGLPLALAIALVWIVGAAQAAPTTKFYTLAVNPTTAQAGTSQSYAVTVGNHLSSTHSIGSANVTIPSGFTVTSPADGATVPVSSVQGNSWNVKNSSGTLEFRATSRGNALRPGDSVSAAATATAPCPAGSYPVASLAKQSNDFSGPPGNNFVQLGDVPAIVVSAAAVDELAFVQEPTDTEAGDAIAPAVSVRAEDACDNPVSGASVGMTIGTNPSGGTLSGTSPQTTDAAGVATFADLSIDKAGPGYTLVASAAGAPSEASVPFDIVDVLCTAFPCELLDPQNITSVSVNGNKPLPAPLGIIRSASGIPFGDGNCGSSFSMGRVVTVLPDTSVASDVLLEVTVRYGTDVVPGSGGVANVRFCANNGPGTDWYEVFNCGPVPSPKCIKHRKSNGGDLVVTALMTWTDPDWGGFF